MVVETRKTRLVRCNAISSSWWTSIVFLPIIDIDPGNLSCIYSTFNFVSNHANQYNVTPILTFDQPLWWKAMSIVIDEKSNSGLSKIILRLGPFHTEMSFLSSIGHLMKGSGLYALIMSHAYDFPLPVTENRDSDLDLVYLEPGEDPTAMFETSGFFRKANLLPVLADVILRSVTMTAALPTEITVQYVIDGGSLLHQVPWKKGMKCSEIFKLYTEYVRKKYGSFTAYSWV